MFKLYCICGTNIPDSQQLCYDCNEEHGHPDTWPEWLKFLVEDIRREVRAERRWRKLTSGGYSE